MQQQRGVDASAAHELLAALHASLCGGVVSGAASTAVPSVPAAAAAAVTAATSPQDMEIDPKPNFSSATAGVAAGVSDILPALQAQVCASEGAAAPGADWQGTACSGCLPAAQAQALAEVCSFVLASVSGGGDRVG